MSGGSQQLHTATATSPRACDAGLLRLTRIWCALGITTFVLLSLAYSAARFPAWDEGLYADVAFAYAEEGRLRSRLMGSTGTFGIDPLPGMDERTYWTTPAYPLLVGTWLQLAGTGIVQVRLPSLAFGLLLLAAWGSIVRSLTGSKAYAYAAAGTIAMGSHVLWAGSMGRPDMMSASLAALAIAAYLRLRERSLPLALSSAAMCMALAGQAHPMALVGGIALLALVLALDRRRLRVSTLLLPAALGLLVLVPWALYILEDPDLFRAQWTANSSARKGGLSQPLHMLATDLQARYLAWHYGPGLSRIRILEILGLATCFGAALLMRSIRRTPGLRHLALLAVIGWASLAILDGTRWLQYFLHVFPAYTALAAVILCRLVEPGSSSLGARGRRTLASALVLMMILPGVGGITLRVMRDPYTSEFLPVVRALEPYRDTGATILAPSELGFGLGFDGRAFQDDMTMRTRADVYVRSPDTLLWQPRVAAELARDFELRFQSERYRVYVRR